MTDCNPYQPPPGGAAASADWMVHINVATHAKHPQWQVLGSIMVDTWRAGDLLPEFPCRVAVVQTPHPRVVELLALCLEHRGLVYCKLENRRSHSIFRRCRIEWDMHTNAHHRLLLQLPSQSVP